MQQKRLFNIVPIIASIVLALPMSTLYAIVPPAGQDFRITVAEIGTEVDTLINAINICAPTALSQTDVINGGMLLTTSGTSYCLSQNITGSIIISASDITVDLNTHSLIGTIDILSMATNATIKNGNVKPLVSQNASDAAHAAIVIGSLVTEARITNCYIICSDSILTGSIGRDGINNGGVNTIIDSCFIQTGVGGNGVSNTGINIQIAECTIITGSVPRGLFAYVTNSGAASVTPIDLATNTLSPPIAVGSTPQGIAITPDGATAYVTNTGGNTVTPIDIATNTPGTDIVVGANPQGIAITPDGATAYVTNLGGFTVTPIDIATNTPGIDIPVGNNPAGIAITPDGATAYVTNRGDTTVTPIAIPANLPGANIPIGSQPNLIAITPDGATAYVSLFGGTDVIPIAIPANTVGSPIAVGLSPNGIAITPDGATAYVANAGGNTVTPITLPNTPLTPIAVGNSPVGIAITPDGATAYVTNLNDNTITPITIATNTPLAPISGFTNPYGIAIFSVVGSGAGNGILQNADNGRIVRTNVTGATSGITIANATNFNSIEECEAIRCGASGFSILTTGTLNLIECVANYNGNHGFDLSMSFTGKGLIKACVASQNGGCGFNDISSSLYKYVANAAEGNGSTPAGATDTNYCITGAGTTLTLPPGPTPYFQFPTNNTGIGFAPTYWNNVTLP